MIGCRVAEPKAELVDEPHHNNQIIRTLLSRIN